MAERKVNRLGFKQCETLKAPGLYADGDGLYLQIGAAGGKSWMLRFRVAGKRREMGLGSYADVSLKGARGKAEEARTLIKSGRDPIVEKKLSTAIGAADRSAVVPLFGDFARTMLKTWIEEFKSPASKRAWLKTFGAAAGDGRPIKDAYAGLLLDRRLDEIDTTLVMAVLQPLWKNGVTASRVRGRIERVLDAAKVLGHISGENPARWSGHLEVLLKKPKRLARGHHKAMEYGEAPAFMSRLRSMSSVRLAGGRVGGGAVKETVTESISALALEFTILTAARTSEVTLAPRAEINFETAVWTIPAERMKEGRDHRVPLSSRAIEILKKVWPFSSSRHDYIFRGKSGNGHLSNMAMSMCLRGLDDSGYTVHGFRSTFRDWVGDETDFPREVAEAALSHLVGDQAEQAYRRGDALERRRQLMQKWSDYLSLHNL